MWLQKFESMLHVSVIFHFEISQSRPGGRREANCTAFLDFGIISGIPDNGCSGCGSSNIFTRKCCYTVPSDSTLF